MHQRYDVLLVVLSALIAFWGSYDAVRIAARVRAAEGRSRRLWLIAAGLSLGIGIWGMHFVAMLALRLPVQIQYVPSLVLLSLLIAVAGTAAAFSAHSRPTLPFRDLWLAVSTGVAISGMHYTAMAGIRLPAELRYTPAVVVLSIGISMVFPVLGLRPLRGTNETVRPPGLWPAMLIATGIVGMHFTGMAAVRFVPQVSLAMPARSLLVASPQLAMIVAIGTAAMITMAELAVVISRQGDAQRAQLRALSSRMETAREAERAHIAREIHDELGQALTVLKLDLERVRSTSGQPSMSATIDAMQARLADTVTALGRLAAGLRPPLLDELGLADGVRALADDVQHRTGLRVHVQVALAEGEWGALDKDLATALYRILQEALTNIVRHANATAVEITLRATPHRLQLEIADNGRGITQRELDDARSLGLLGMRERARTWNGEVVITAAGRGTSVIVTIPLRHGAA